MVEADEQEAEAALHEGLELAAQIKETTIDAHGDYVPDTETGCRPPTPILLQLCAVLEIRAYAAGGRR